MPLDTDEKDFATPYHHLQIPYHSLMSMAKIRTAVIPAGGLGTRILPATKVLPKEMLPVADKPLIQFAVEEAAASGLERIIFVIGPGKSLLAEHFQRNESLENILLRQHRNAAAEQIRKLSMLAEVRTVWQETPLGLADAIRCARPLIDNEPFAVILPDALIDSEVPCTRQLMDCHDTHPGCIIATQLVESSEVNRYGILDLTPIREPNGNVSRVNTLIERPQPKSVTSRHGIFGRYILEPDIFPCIEKISSGFGGELQLTDALALCCRQFPVYACQFAGTHYDAGSKLGFLQASIAYALKDPELEQPLRDYLLSLCSTETATSV
jgi:UTP--glucose-1-phosphate uridylyltransferase